MLNDYIQLYAAAVATKEKILNLWLDLNLTPMIRIQFLLEHKSALALFMTMGEFRYFICFGTILHPVLDPETLSRDDRIFWNAQFTGSTFCQDQARIWSYLAQRCINTAAWKIIKGY